MPMVVSTLKVMQRRARRLNLDLSCTAGEIQGPRRASANTLNATVFSSSSASAGKRSGAAEAAHSGAKMLAPPPGHLSPAPFAFQKAGWLNGKKRNANSVKHSAPFGGNENDCWQRQSVELMGSFKRKSPKHIAPSLFNNITHPPVKLAPLRESGHKKKKRFAIF